MNAQIINDSQTVKARKDHKCNYCNFLIPKGENYNTQTLKFEGSIYTWKSHLRCDKIASALNMFDNYGEGVTDDMFYEFITDEFHEIWSKKYPEHYESKDFKIPSFKEQLDFVCEYHIKEEQK